MNGAKSKVIEDLEGAGVWGGLAPIIKIRISGPPGSGTLRGVDTVVWRKDIRTVTSPM
mgnify:FL=1